MEYEKADLAEGPWREVSHLGPFKVDIYGLVGRSAPYVSRDIGWVKPVEGGKSQFKFFQRRYLLFHVGVMPK